MCVVSMVTDHFRTAPQKYWTPERWDDYEELKRKAALYDEMTKQKDCFDPSKQEFEERVLKLLEQKFGFKPKKKK